MVCRKPPDDAFGRTEILIKIMYVSVISGASTGESSNSRAKRVSCAWAVWAELYRQAIELINPTVGFSVRLCVCVCMYVCMFVCLSLEFITQKRLNGTSWNFAHGSPITHWCAFWGCRKNMQISMWAIGVSCVFLYKSLLWEGNGEQR